MSANIGNIDKSLPKDIEIEQGDIIWSGSAGNYVGTKNVSIHHEDGKIYNYTITISNIVKKEKGQKLFNEHILNVMKTAYLHGVIPGSKKTLQYSVEENKFTKKKENAPEYEFQPINRKEQKKIFEALKDKQEVHAEILKNNLKPENIENFSPGANQFLSTARAAKQMNELKDPTAWKTKIKKIETKIRQEKALEKIIIIKKDQIEKSHNKDQKTNKDNKKTGEQQKDIGQKEDIGQKDSGTIKVTPTNVFSNSTTMEVTPKVFSSFVDNPPDSLPIPQKPKPKYPAPPSEASMDPTSIFLELIMEDPELKKLTDYVSVLEFLDNPNRRLDLFLNELKDNDRKILLNFLLDKYTQQTFSMFKSQLEEIAKSERSKIINKLKLNNDTKTRVFAKRLFPDLRIKDTQEWKEIRTQAQMRKRFEDKANFPNEEIEKQDYINFLNNKNPIEFFKALLKLDERSFNESCPDFLNIPQDEIEEDFSVQWEQVRDSNWEKQFDTQWKALDEGHFNAIKNDESYKKIIRQIFYLEGEISASIQNLPDESKLKVYRVLNAPQMQSFLLQDKKNELKILTKSFISKLNYDPLDLSDQEKDIIREIIINDDYKNYNSTNLSSQIKIVLGVSSFTNHLTTKNLNFLSGYFSFVTESTKNLSPHLLMIPSLLLFPNPQAENVLNFFNAVSFNSEKEKSNVINGIKLLWAIQEKEITLEQVFAIPAQGQPLAQQSPAQQRIPAQQPNVQPPQQPIVQPAPAQSQAQQPNLQPQASAQAQARQPTGQAQSPAQAQAPRGNPELGPSSIHATQQVHQAPQRSIDYKKLINDYKKINKINPFMENRISTLLKDIMEGNQSFEHIFVFEENTLNEESALALKIAISNRNLILDERRKQLNNFVRDQIIKPNMDKILDPNQSPRLLFDNFLLNHYGPNGVEHYNKNNNTAEEDIKVREKLLNKYLSHPYQLDPALILFDHFFLI